MWQGDNQAFIIHVYNKIMWDKGCYIQSKISVLLGSQISLITKLSSSTVTFGLYATYQKLPKNLYFWKIYQELQFQIVN